MYTKGSGSSKGSSKSRASSTGSKRKPIKIAKSKKGTFTKYCKNKGYGGVTSECIAEGKRSKNPATRKKATFAGSSRKWKKGK